MNYEEFKERTVESASYEQFQRFEKMYMACNIDKDIFCRLMKPLVLAELESETHDRDMKRADHDYQAALVNAGAALDRCDADAFEKALEDAKEAGRRYAASKAEVERIYNYRIYGVTLKRN